MEDNIQDAIAVHKYLKAKFMAENSEFQFALYEEYFILLEESGKPVISSIKLDDILDKIKELGLEDLGYYTS